MAFRIDCTLEDYEFRVLRSGVSSKSGQNWYSLVLESPTAEQVDVSVPAELQGDVLSAGLVKGDHVSCAVTAVSSKDYSFVRLIRINRVIDVNGEVQF